MRINKIKELEEIETELRWLGVKVMMERIKDNLEEFEIKMLENETEREALKQKKDTLRKQMRLIKKKQNMKQNSYT